MSIYNSDLKHCTKCKTTKSIGNFYNNKSSKDGLTGWCKSCHKSIPHNPKKVKKVSPPKKDILHEYYQAKKDARAYENAKNRRYVKKREQDDPLLKVQRIVRGIVTDAFKRSSYTKNSKTYEIIGCTYVELKLHIEKQFKPGMTWDNHGQWHIDHIIPVSYGITVEEIIALNNYINLQPLWAQENLSKGNRYIG